MPPFFFACPATFQGTLIAMLPWLASSIAIGAFAGYQRAESARQKKQLARQQAMVERLAGTSAEFRVILARQATMTTPTTARSVPPLHSTTKHSLLQRVVADNRNLHDEMKNTTGDQQHV